MLLALLADGKSFAHTDSTNIYESVFHHFHGLGMPIPIHPEMGVMLRPQSRALESLLPGFAKGHGQHGHGGHELNGKVVSKGSETFAVPVPDPDLRPAGDGFDARPCSAVAGTCEGV